MANVFFGNFLGVPFTLVLSEERESKAKARQSNPVKQLFSARAAFYAIAPE
jgi:hypothetical protein